ncbi:phosphotransferase enzyme family-domain-containing protein [Aspergillus caelatus]|uniref:Phosphotransferase enzyme family-domain-containing protein n=1 Tax=Aspergillus caelatus TaxID=61420 RepID=A0A5N7AD29_9EURO|nr:phosphotransferase enzyme family-domain-containing protein [Aspergillus caelatus]KAE8367076.1 phosphotransferase enzyme family-domain-containing protein [Aspergillus caelatus]
MACSRPTKTPLQWHTTFAGSSPVWPSEPAISAIVSIASAALSAQHTQVGDVPSITVNFFAQGTFNKNYEIVIPNQGHKFLFRVTLPVDPFFKTESEVATLAFLRQKTSIPVPEVVAWSSTSDNALGYEWILLKKVEGVPLEQKWRAISLETKIQISERLAAYAAELRSLPFDRIGSLYFEGTNTSAETNSSAQDSQQIKFMSSYLGKGVEVGQMVLPFFFFKRRLYIPSNRGPFANSLQYLSAKVQMQTAWIKSGVEIAKAENASDIDSDCDEDLLEEAPEMLEVCQAAQELIVRFFPPTDPDTCHTLYHHDLNQNNIILDPISHDIVAVIDWEMICVLPQWASFYYPKMFLDVDPVTEEEPPIPVDYNDENDYTIIRRDRWDARILRRTFDTYIQTVSRDTNNINFSDGFEERRTLEDVIEDLTDNWEGARATLRDLQARAGTVSS